VKHYCLVVNSSGKCLMALGSVTKNKPTFVSLPFLVMLAGRLRSLGMEIFVILLECDSLFA
jgi:hypothetical protein